MQNDKPSSFQERIEEAIGAPLFRYAPPKGYRGVKHIATIITVGDRMAAELNAQIRELSVENSQLSGRVAVLADEVTELRRQLSVVSVKYATHEADLSPKQSERLLAAVGGE